MLNVPSGSPLAYQGQPAWAQPSVPRRSSPAAGLLHRPPKGYSYSRARPVPLPARALQWEYQVGPCTGIEAGDQLWMSRYILYRICGERAQQA